jgi:hypothetical protein
VSYTLRKEEEEEEADGGEILGGTGYGRWGRVFLFSKSTPSCDTNTTQNCCPFLYRSNATKSEVTRFLNVPLDVSDVFLMTFMILLDSYMEPTRVGSDSLGYEIILTKQKLKKHFTYNSGLDLP